MAYTLSVDINLGAGNSGLTLTPALFDSANVAAAGLTTSTMVEVSAGAGSYLWTGTIPDGHRGYISFSSGATFKSKVVLNAQEVENTDVKTSTRSSHTAADVWTSGTRTLTSFGTLVADVTTAVWAAGTRTLTSFGTLVTDIAAAVWSYGTRTLTELLTGPLIVAPATINDEGELTLLRGDTAMFAITGLGSLAGRSKLWFTLKDDLGDADTAALAQIEETAGLVYLNGAAGISAQGSLTVTDEDAGNVAIMIAAAATAQLANSFNNHYDIQILAGTVRTLTVGMCQIRGDATRRTS
jgi:hypothetical protein